MHRIQVYPMSVGPTAVGMFHALCAPYALGCLVAHARAHEGGRLNESFDFRPITPAFHEHARAHVDHVADPGIFLFSSYVWNHDANTAVARHVKQHLPGSLVVFGGPEVPRALGPLRAFLEKHPFIDIAVRGEGELTLVDILDAIIPVRADAGGLLRCDYSTVAGATFRSGAALLDGPDRGRAATIEAYPSPYTTGLFDHWIEETNYMPLETNRGCPYGCTFCDWGASTMSKIRSFAMDRVLGDIDYAGTHRLSSIFVCDANFGILKRDPEIAQHIAEVSRRTGFPKLVSYSAAKVVRAELRSIIKTLHDAGLNAFGQISIQTTDPSVLELIDRSNIKLSEYDSLVRFFRQEDIPGLSELMVGLPGQTTATTRKDLQFLFDRKIHGRIFPTSIMPNAPMADPSYREKHRLRVDGQGFVSSSFSFDEAEYERMCELCYAYKLLANFGTGMLKYLLLFLQVDRQVPALDVIQAWLDAAQKGADTHPISDDVYRKRIQGHFKRPGRDVFLLSWDESGGRDALGRAEGLCRELLDVTQSNFGVSTAGSDIEAVVMAQVAVLPGPMSAPRSIHLEHDAAAYVASLRALVNIQERPEGFRPLADYGPGELRIDEARTTLSYNDFTAPFDRLEAPSNVFI